MTRDDIIRMAREAGFTEGMAWLGEVLVWEAEPKNLERFAALVAAAEREACAKVCEALGNDALIDEMEYRAFCEADEAIRARGEGKS